MRSYPTVPTGRGHETVQTSPTACPNGHQLRGNAFVSTLPCLCALDDGGSHMAWECRTCGVITYDPPHTVAMAQTFPRQMSRDCDGAVDLR